jgi:polyferredoxin
MFTRELLSGDCSAPQKRRAERAAFGDASRTGTAMADMIGGIVIAATIIVLAIIWGRAFCGRVCPFGYLQDLLFKVPFPVKLHHFKADGYLRWLKYAVIALWLATNLLAVIPRDTPEVDALSAGMLVALPVAVMLFIVIQRPLCKYFCPGAMLGLGNRSPLNRYKVDEKKCTDCGLCFCVCKMGIDPTMAPNSIECIRCGRCKKCCRQKAIASNLSNSSTP